MRTLFTILLWLNITMAIAQDSSAQISIERQNELHYWNYTVMQVRKSDMAITRMTIYGNSESGTVVKKMEILFFDISRPATMEDSQFLAARYVNTDGKNYLPTKKYSNYKIIMEKTVKLTPLRRWKLTPYRRSKLTP